MDEKLDEALKQTFPASDSFALFPREPAARSHATNPLSQADRTRHGAESERGN